MLGGFSPLLSHATLTRDGHAVRVHLSATHEETLRLLALALHMIGGDADVQVSWRPARAARSAGAAGGGDAQGRPGVQRLIHHTVALRQLDHLVQLLLRGVGLDLEPRMARNPTGAVVDA